MKRLLIISAVVAPILTLGTAGRASAQAIFPGAGPGYGSSYDVFSGISGYGGYSRAIGAGPSGFAMPFQATPRPAFSPYLEFLRGGNPAANYFLGVLPDQRPPIYNAPLVPDISTVRRPGIDQYDDLLPVLPETGHQVRFLNYGPFFNLGQAPRTNLLSPYGQRRP
jgi:hypothetical protein